MAMASRMDTIAITIINSIKVKPAASARRRVNRRLPVGIRSSIRGLVERLGINVKHILTAPTGGVRIILHAPFSPVGGARHGIPGHSAKKTDLPGTLTKAGDDAIELDALNQRFKGRRIAVLFHFPLNFPGVAHVLVFVDGGVHLSQGVAQLLFALTANLVAGHRNGHATQHQKNGEGYHQLDKRETGLTPATASKWRSFCDTTTHGVNGSSGAASRPQVA